MMEEKGPHFTFEVCVDSEAKRKTFDDMLNNAYSEGYEVFRFIVEGKNYIAMMRQKDPGYENVVEVADAPVEKANELLQSGTGWEIASTSVSSKFYRMVRRNKQSDRCVDEEQVE